MALAALVLAQPMPGWAGDGVSAEPSDGTTPVPTPVAVQPVEDELQSQAPPWARNVKTPETPAAPGGVPDVSTGEGTHESEPATPPIPETAGAGVTNEALFWVNTEALLWWTRNSNSPPLLTTGETTVQRPGAFGQDETKILYGNNGISFQNRLGARFIVGASLDRSSPWSLEAIYFFLDARRAFVDYTSPGTPVLARPFLDVVNNAQDSSLVTYPGVVHGNIHIDSTSFLQGAELNLQHALWQGEKSSVQLLAGARYLNLIESLSIAETVVGDQNALDYYMKQINVLDHFGVNNQFYGGQLGMRGTLDYKRFRFGLLAKLALGDTHESVNIGGLTMVNGLPLNNGGLLALSSNSGSFNHNAFALVPELGANAGLRITPWLTAYVGYTFLYWSRVARPAEQIDTGLNPNLIPTSATFGSGGPARPAFHLQESSFWAQGISLGFAFRY